MKGEEDSYTWHFGELAKQVGKRGAKVGYKQRQTKWWCEMAEMFCYLSEEISDLSSSYCENVNWDSLLSLYETLRYIVSKKMMILVNTSNNIQLPMP